MSKKKKIVVIAAAAAIGLGGVVGITACVNNQESAGKTTAAQFMEQLSKKIKVGEKLSVSVSGKIISVTVQEMTSDGAVCTDDAGQQYLITPEQLNAYVKAHPDQFGVKTDDDNSSDDTQGQEQ